jgi:hypothetical protein
MVGHGRYENSQDHRNRTTVARREDEREELRLVADLRENDDSGRNEKCFQDSPQAAKARIVSTREESAKERTFRE